MRNGLGALALAVALTAGCAGDDGRDDEAVEAFRADANAVCADFQERIALIPPPLEDEEEWAAVAADIGDHLEVGVNELAALEPPESIREDYEEWLELKRQGLAATRDLQLAGAADDPGLVAEALAAIEEVEADADPLAEALGLDECATTE